MSKKKEIEILESVESKAAESIVLSDRMVGKVSRLLLEVALHDADTFSSIALAAKDYGKIRQSEIEKAEKRLSNLTASMADVAASGDVAAITSLSAEIVAAKAAIEKAQKMTADSAQLSIARKIATRNYVVEIFGNRKTIRKDGKELSQIFAVTYNGKTAIVVPNLTDSASDEFELLEYDGTLATTHGKRKIGKSVTDTMLKLSPVFTDDEIIKIHRAGKNKTSFVSQAAKKMLDSYMAQYKPIVATDSVK